MTRIFFFALLSVAGCTSQGSDVDAAQAIDAAVVADAGRDGSVSIDAGHDASPAMDAGTDAFVGADAFVGHDAGHDAFVGQDAFVGPDTDVDAAPPMCPGTMHVCFCATGWYCVHIGASCLAETAPCPG